VAEKQHQARQGQNRTGMDDKFLTIIGGGLAGCEAAWQAAKRGCRVTLYDMKPQRFSPAHSCSDLAELVWPN